MNRIASALKSRRQNRQSSHFETTSYGKRLAQLKDAHRGEACVIVGNGPSLQASDLQRIYELGIPTFGTNRIFKLFNDTDWRPTYYVSEDVKVLRDVQREIEAVPSEARFIPINLNWFEGVDIKGADYFYIEYSASLPETHGLSLDVSHCVRCRSTVTATCLQFAIYMGFAKIYLIGVDHNFAKMVDKDGNVIIDETVQDHFINDYSEGIPNEGFSVDDATEAYMDTERLSRELGTFKVFNATRGGKLEVFKRVNLDDLLAKRKEDWA